MEKMGERDYVRNSANTNRSPEISNRDRTAPSESGNTVAETIQLLAALSIVCLDNRVLTAGADSFGGGPSRQNDARDSRESASCAHFSRERLKPRKVSSLHFRCRVCWSTLPVKEGQKVAKGQLIAQLRQDEFQARLKSVQGQLDQARAILSALQLGEREEERLRREALLRAARREACECQDGI